MIKDKIFAALSGVANGLFGSGGGLLAVPMLKGCYGLEARRAQSTAPAIIFPMCVVSAALYMGRGDIDWGLTWKVTLGCTAGAALGAFFLGKFKNVWLDRAIAVAMLVCGVRMVLP
nr:sulfite exporter TauE/SafE family protein [bacterium]